MATGVVGQRGRGQVAASVVGQREFNMKGGVEARWQLVLLVRGSLI